MKRLTVVLLFVLSSLFYGCSRDAITVNGEGISKEIYNLTVKERVESHKAMGVKFDEKAIRRSVADELIAEVLLLKEAKAKKINVSDEEVKKAIDSIRGNRNEQEFKKELEKVGLSYAVFQKRVKNNLMINKLMEEFVKEDSVTEKDMIDFYKKTPIVKPESVFVKILQITNEQDANAASTAIKKGEDFDKLAERLLKENKAFMTDYGWLNPDTISKEIGNAMKVAKIDQVYGPYKGKDGTHYFFKIKKKEPAGVLSFENAKPQIKAMILQQRRQELMAHIVELNRKKVKIKYNVKV
jgi:parvulin-like peptidyl-prolyl isomerase